MKLKGSLFALALGFTVMAGTANAHTISVGSFNAGAPGSVSLVLGTYDHGVPLVQGSVQLIAGPCCTPSPIQPFTTVLLSKPSSLVDGDNNFYADSTSANWGGLPSDSFHQPTNTVQLGPVVNWLSATFTGLTAGIYTYQITGMTAANWNNINSFEANWTGTLVVTGTSTGVPEPASMLLLGLGVVGMAVRRKLAA